MTDKQRVKKNTETSDSPAGAELSFEASLAQLEKTIDRLESDDLTLDSSLQLFEKGITLIRTCDSHLKKAQGKISELLKGEDGELVEKILGSSLEAFMTKDTADE